MDLVLFNFLHNLAGESFIVDALGVFLARYLPYIMIAAGLFYILFKEDHWQMKAFSGLFILLTVLLSRGLFVHVIREFFEKFRPFDVIGFEPLFTPVHELAFPSGHAALLFSLSFALFLFNKKWGGWFLFLAFINGLARVFSGVHWPLDILGGVVVGLISFSLVYVLLEKQYKVLYKREVASDDLEQF